jgi:hypothetical protein
MILGEVHDLFARHRDHVFLPTAGVTELLLRLVSLRKVRENDSRFISASINLLSPIPQPRFFRRDRGPDWEPCWKRSQSITR